MEWYPTPSYLVKRKVILDFIRGIKGKKFLEVGCGAGDLLSSLAKYGFYGVGIDISPEALTAARKHPYPEGITLEQKDLSEVNDVFDVVIASEVLEHHKDDVNFLENLRARICQGGYLLLTVPAHMHKWGANDEFTGHVRRYEREEICQKLRLAHLEVVALYSYGVPIYNLMKPFYDRAIRNKRKEIPLLDRTKKSAGMWLFPGMNLLFKLLFNDITMYPFYLLQRLFFNTDLGNGYFIAAKKISN